MKLGDLVIATAGKEKGQTLVVVGADSQFVLLADGKRLKAAKPKRKSLKHVKACKGQLDLTCEELKLERVNAKIRNYLKKERACQKKTL